jgi:CopG family nickel-responsive transcriptional regulator
MKKAGYTDRSKAIQTALHSFINENDWKETEGKNGAGTITILYDNHTFNQDSASTQIQHKYSDIISAATHMHLSHNNCLETIMVRDEIKKIKELTEPF